jgi:hypothetical protein
MTAHDDIVPRVISLCRVRSARRRREIEKELHAHVEDIAEEARSQGYDDAAVGRIVELRFGKPHEVAAAFASVYAPDRVARCVVGLGILAIVSFVAVVLVIGSVQSIVAICAARSIAASFRYIRWESFGFAAIVLGYCSLYLGERLFPASLAKALLPSATLIFCVGAVVFWVAPGHVALPLIAFTCAAFGRLLQSVDIPLVWLAGIAGPLLIAWAFFGPFVPGRGQFLCLVWLGLTISCKVLQEIVQLFERFVFIESFG